MLSLYRSWSSPIKRGAHLGIWYTQRLTARPLLIQTLQYSQFKGGKDDKGSQDTSTVDGGKKKKSAESSESKKSAEDSSNDKASSETDKKSETGKKNKDGKVEPEAPKINIRILPAMYPKYGYDEKNMKLGRELSPHLSIYKIQLTSVLSIFLRISGFVLAIGVWIIGLSALFKVNLHELAQKAEKCKCSPTILKVLKFCLIMPFAYHAVAGTRHLIWYLGVFLSLPQIYATGYAAIALSLMLAMGLTCINLEEMVKEPKKVSYDRQIELQPKILSEYVNDEAENELMTTNDPTESFYKENE